MVLFQKCVRRFEGSFQQSLVEIGSVGSEEKIFFFIPLFLFLAWRPSWLEIGITAHNFGNFFKWPKLLYFKPESTQI
jgi:hypothetical protein